MNTKILLEQARLIAGDHCAVHGAVHTVADPFPIFHRGVLFVFAEIEGTDQSGDYFKWIGVFRCGDDIDYLGRVWPDNDSIQNRYSFPYIFGNEGKYWMLPDSTQMSGDDKSVELLVCEYDAFPFGWRRETVMSFPGVHHPSDKVVFAYGDFWWAFVSDSAQGGRLCAFWAREFGDWTPVGNQPILKRAVVDRLANRLLPNRLYRIAPWRLGGGPFVMDGVLQLPIQHMWSRKIYGEALSTLSLTLLDPQCVEGKLSATPFLLPHGSMPWVSHGVHHFALAQDGERIACTVDGFDGRGWQVGVLKDISNLFPTIKPLSRAA